MVEHLTVVSALVVLAACTMAAAPLKPGDVVSDGMALKITPLNQTVQVEPLKSYENTVEGELPIGKPSWQGPYRLPVLAWKFRALTPGSLRVTAVGAAGAKLAEGEDYLLDPDWAALAAVDGSAHAGKKLTFTYRYTKSRLDLLEVAADQKVSIVKGEEHMTAPRLPTATPGSTALAGIYVRHNTTAIDPRDVNLIDPSETGIPNVLCPDAVKTAAAKLASDEPMSLVFFGDSITAMSEKDLGPKGNFVDRFAKSIEARLPHRRVTQTTRDRVVTPTKSGVVVVKAGVGGDDTAMALARMDADVIAHRPDVVVIMFGVNDENRSGGTNKVPVTQYRANLLTMISKIRATGAIPVIMTTSMKNLDWVTTAGTLHEYAKAARELAAEQNVTLIDAFAAWEALPKRGLNYMVLLDSAINHPGDQGHELFQRGIEAAFLP